MRSDWKDGARTRAVVVSPEAQGRYRVRIDDGEIVLHAEPLGDGRWRLTGEGTDCVAEVTASGARRFVNVNGMDFVLERLSGDRKRAKSADAGSLEAPMPGVVTRVMVAVGEAVVKGQPLVAVEAMKMEHVVRSPRDGTIKKLPVAAGQMVQGGATLVELEASGVVA